MKGHTYSTVKNAWAGMAKAVPFSLVAGVGMLGLGIAQAPPPPPPPPPGTTPFVLQRPMGIPQPPLRADNPLTVQGVALGRRLFHEVRLSGNNTQSCASCHRPNAGFSDQGRATSVGIDGVRGTRNTPTLHNVAFVRPLFWDGRSPGLREQALLPIQNPIEMHQSLDAAVAKLKADPTYVAEFGRAFGSPGIDPRRIGLALEQFEVTLLSGNSRFDRGAAALTAQENRGRQLFFTPVGAPGQPVGAGCVRCHGGPILSDNRFHNVGLDSVSADRGRAAVTGLAADVARFKTPTLRNVAVTGPYMHDGRFRTLEEVVRFYSDGVKPSPTVDPGLNRIPGGLRLTPGQQADLVAFMRTLTDPRYVTGTTGP